MCPLHLFTHHIFHRLSHFPSCRDESSYHAGYCFTSPVLSEVGGLLDSTVVDNKFSIFTLVVVLYCSGIILHTSCRRNIAKKLIIFFFPRRLVLSRLREELE